MIRAISTTGSRALAWTSLLLLSSIRAAAAPDVPRPAFGRPLPVGDPPPSLVSPAPTISPVAPAGPPLTLTDLENLALANNPTLPAAAALVQQQQGLMRQATLYPNPTAGYVRTDADQPGQTQTSGVFLSQEFVTPGKRHLAAAAGRFDVEHSDWQFKAQRERVLNDVRIRFYEVLGAQEALAAAVEMEALAAEGVRVAQQLLAAKQGSRPDLLQAEIQLSTVRSAVQDARHRIESSRRQLTHVAGVAELPSPVLAGQLEQDLPQLDWQLAAEQVLANSPLLHGQQALIESVKYELKLARAQAIPNLSLQLVAQRDSIQKYSSVSTLVSVPVPLFNRNQGNVLNVEGQLIQQQKEYERIRLAILDQLAVAFRQHQSLRDQVSRWQQEILPRSRENLELTTTAYKAGQFDFPRVLAARQTYFQTKLAYIDALTELHKTGIEIRGMLLTGGLNPTEVGTALQGQGGTGAGMRGILLQQSQEQRNAASRNLPGAIQAGER